MKQIIIIVYIVFCFTLFGQSAKSVGTANAMSSVDKGFESLLFNPAALVFTQRRFGISLWQNMYFKMYNNTFSTDDILEMNELVKITNFISDKIEKMPDGGIEAAVEAELFSSFCYINIAEWNNYVYNSNIKVPRFQDAFQNKSNKTVRVFENRKNRGVEREEIKHDNEELTTDNADVAFVELDNEISGDNTSDSKISLEIIDATNDSEQINMLTEADLIIEGSNYISIKLDNSRREITDVIIYYPDNAVSYDKDTLSQHYYGEYFLLPVNDTIDKVEVVTDKPIANNSLSMYQLIDIEPKKTSSIFNNLAFGFGGRLRNESNIRIGKGIVNSLFKELSLEDGLLFDSSFYFREYIDLFISASYRLEFLEKKLPFQTRISVGLAQHVYIPTMLISFSGDFSFKKGEPSADLGLYSYLVDFNGEAVIATSSAFKELFKLGKQDFTDMLANNSSFGFGLGWDLGYYMEFPFGIAAGVSVTDLGFIVFPKASLASVTMNTELDFSNLSKISDDFQNAVTKSPFTDGSYTFTPNTTMRLGAMIDPLKDTLKYFYIVGGMNFSLHSFNKIELRGYPTFEWSNAIDFGPKIPFATKAYDIRFPVRLGILYSTDTNFPSISTGLGFLAGPVSFEMGVQGLEFLIRKWGMRNTVISLEMKYAF
ncbi:MAG TPA: hypothetical protein DC057_10680 [Spirochaetia bacterium]|nr:hypothetical protein [Spirochaetia bacterium]